MNKLRLFLGKQLEDFNDAAFIRLLKIFILIASVIIVYAGVFSGFQIVDEFEHLHASWLVSIGKMPYRDFLEHHNPLLWFLCAPIVSAFYDNAIIFYVMRIISAGASVLIGWYLYKMALFWGDKKSGWLAVALYFGNIITFYNFYQFRPDNFMNLCFIAGMYYWFVALKTNALKPLTISFLFFTFSFLFLQKISLLLAVVEVLLLGLAVLKKMKIKAMSIAAIPSLLVLFLFLAFFYAKDTLPIYLDINYRFNHAMLYYYERGAFWYKNFCFSIYGLAFVTALLFFKKENIYFKLTAIIFCAEFLMRGFYFAPYTHYYSLVTILEALVLSVYATKIMPKYKLLGAVVLILMFLYLGLQYNRLEKSIPKHNSYDHYQLVKWAHENSKPDEALMNGYDMIFNIYRPDVGYYWFQLDTLVPIIEREYDISNKVDVNKQIIKYRPKFVYAANYVDALSFRLYGEKKFAQKFMPELLTSLYKPTPFSGLWELK